MEKVLVDKKLMTLKEMCMYLNIGQTKAREILKDKNCKFSVRIGNRLYANKALLDEWVDSISGDVRSRTM